jgi:hypothetical protein
MKRRFQTRDGWFRALPLVAILVVATDSDAQWLNHRNSRIPRTADGQPDLAAASPRAADGKPDLSGVWRPPFRYFGDLAVDGVKVPFQSWAEALFRERKGNNRKDHPRARCLPIGLPQMIASPYPVKVIQTPDVVVVLYEAENVFRQLFLDARTMPPDPEPTWRGYSIGHWDGDDLVVVTQGFNGKSWLDYAGHPQTDALRLTERFTRPDFGHLRIRITIDDPKAYTAPWTVTEEYILLPDSDLLEEVCLENEKDVEHLVGK